MALETKFFEEVKRIFVAYLEKKELRKTPERFAILEEIYSRKDHFDVEELYISMKNKNYRVSRATVYNTLDLLTDCDLVTKHQFGKNLAQYEKAYGFKQHDHLICVECHKVLEFCDPRLQTIQDMVGNLMEFSILHHSLIFYGQCNKLNCENKGKNLNTEKRYRDDEVMEK
jgi:Fur family transcriptional regulator, ferric uptake regulator